MVHDTVEVRGIRVVPDLLLDIELSGTDLPSSRATRAFGAALQAVAAVQPQTVVPAGQYYATGQDAQGYISSRQAATRLQAQMRFALEGCGPSPFCLFPLDPRLAFAPGQRIWSVGLFLTARWRFTPPAGPAVLSPAVPLVLPLQLLLADDGAGGWTVVTPPPSPTTTMQGPSSRRLADQLGASLCQSGVALAGELVQAKEPNGHGLRVPYDRGVEGCEFQMHDSSGTTVQGTFLWRFGVLLAVDKGAHILAPWLPPAPESEIVAVEG